MTHLITPESQRQALNTVSLLWVTPRTTRRVKKHSHRLLTPTWSRRCSRHYPRMRSSSWGVYTQTQSAELEISSILHSCIIGKEPFRLIETEFILSKLEPSTEDEPDLEELIASLVVSETDEPKQ